MATIKILTPVFTSDGLKAVDDTASVPMAEARQELALGRARWNHATTQDMRNVDSLTLTSLNGSGLTSMDSLLLRTSKLGDIIEVFITADGGPPRRYQVQVKGALVPEGDAIIEPKDYDATSNDKVLVQI